MLARTAEKYDIVDELCDELGVLRRADSTRAKTCIYMCGRIRGVVDVLKYCKTEQQRVDYHTVIGACAPRRTPEAFDPDGMYALIAEELGLAPYGRCAAAVRSPTHPRGTP